MKNTNLCGRITEAMPLPLTRGPSLQVVWDIWRGPSWAGKSLIFTEKVGAGAEGHARGPRLIWKGEGQAGPFQRGSEEAAGCPWDHSSACSGHKPHKEES